MFPEGGNEKQRGRTGVQKKKTGVMHAKHVAWRANESVFFPPSPFLIMFSIYGTRPEISRQWLSRLNWTQCSPEIRPCWNLTSERTEG